MTEAARNGVASCATARRPPPRRGLRAAALGAVALSALLAAAAQAATLTLGVIGRDDDPRLERSRVELGYLGQPGGPVTDGVEMALQETRFQLEAAKLEVKLEDEQVHDAASTLAALRKLDAAGAVAAIVDLPAEWLAPNVGQVKLAVFNVGEPADSLRAVCAPNLLHTLPSERMRADALAQSLASRRWSRVLLLHGPSAADASRKAVVEAAIKRYGLRLAGSKAYKLSADPRERDLANVLLLTGGAEYDAVWVVDSDGEFARSLPYRTALPRPVVGDGGLLALAWAPNFERFGAPQLSRRFVRAAKRPMVAQDWAAWIATKAVVQAATEKPGSPVTAAGLTQALLREDFNLDGFKGSRTSFRAWDRQLRQPLLLTDGIGVIGLAPVEGILHPRNVLDTLGADQPESPCKPGAAR